MSRKNINDVYTEYYLNQAGSGFGNVYAGGVYQKGHGIGSFLGGLFRCVFPILKSGSAVLGSELLKSGANVMSDISRNEDPEVVIRKRGKETINNLSRIVGDKMFGCGYSAAPKRKRGQSANSSQRVKKSKVSKKPPKTQRKRKNRTKDDIFDIFT